MSSGKWKEITDKNFKESGDIILTQGDHEITFKDIDGYYTPNNITINVSPELNESVTFTINPI